MRYTLTVGLLVCMLTVALLALAGVAVLAGTLRHRRVASLPLNRE